MHIHRNISGCGSVSISLYTVEVICIYLSLATVD